MSTALADESIAGLDTRFCADIRNLLKRHHVPCAGERDLLGLGETLFTNAAFRSDLFALCNSISHMADQDLTTDELLALVVAGYGPGLSASIENRKDFASAYEGWHARELAIELPERGSGERAAAVKPAGTINEMDETLQRISESSLELKLFLADVKQRVREIDPELEHLERMIAQMKDATQASVLPTGQEGVAIILPLQTGGSAADARVRRLRVTVGILVTALVLALGGAAWLARGYAGWMESPAVRIVEGAAVQPVRKAPMLAAKAGAKPSATVAPTGSSAATVKSEKQGGGPARRANPRVEPPRSLIPAARLPAPIIRRDPGVSAVADVGPRFVPSSTMIEYALASPKPMYPAVSVPDDKTGRVEVQATISSAGEVVATRVLSGPVIFRDAAEHAMKGWRFRPYLVDGRPVEVSTTVAFVFRSMPAT